MLELGLRHQDPRSVPYPPIVNRTTWSNTVSCRHNYDPPTSAQNPGRARTQTSIVFPGFIFSFFWWERG